MGPQLFYPDDAPILDPHFVCEVLRTQKTLTHKVQSATNSKSTLLERLVPVGKLCCDLPCLGSPPALLPTHLSWPALVTTTRSHALHDVRMGLAQDLDRLRSQRTGPRWGDVPVCAFLNMSAKKNAASWNDISGDS